ncbi:MAG: hypothetical protein ACPGUC_06450 [Gammaproteobacteria bacterium]
MTYSSRWIPLLIMSLSLGACISNPITSDRMEETPVQQAGSSIPDNQILDLWVETFDPGKLPEDEGKARGLSKEIRDAEARFMAVHLAKTIERTGYWGAVRVVPKGTEGAEVLVRGTVLRSDAEQLELEIEAYDARGERWLRETYEHHVEAKEYRNMSKGSQDAFQPLYNAIANDLIKERADLEAREITRIRQIAELRFAADLAPQPFDSYLKKDSDGTFEAVRLPAEGDPMVRRVRAVRDRDYLLIDTLNSHYDHYYNEMWTPYDGWRTTRAEEAAALREVEEAATTRKVLGGLAILGGILLTASTKSSDSIGARSVKSSVGQLMVLGGAAGVISGFSKDSETTIHEEALEELGDSFTQEVKPLVVEVDGETHKLTGSAENQYKQWRALLRKAHAVETGLPSRLD